MYKVVAFYTKDTPYEDVIQKLQGSMIKYRVPNYVKGYESRGAWVKNCAIKPEFILHCLEELDEDILYVDADAEFLQAPNYELFKGELHYYKFKGREALSGTIFFKNTERVKKFVRIWIEIQKQHPTVFDQETMARAIEAVRGNLDVRALPKEYIKIFDLMKHVENAVVLHHQASRKYKDNTEIRRLPMSDFELPVGVRILANGTYCLVRANRTIEKYMDEHLKRSGGPRERLWFPELEGAEVNVFKDLFKGQVCTIVGKGPSLDLLNQKDIKGEGPVIALNEAIHKVEKLGLSKDKHPLFVVQQDAHLKDSCQPTKKDTKLLVSYLSGKCAKDHENRFLYRPVDLGLRDASLTVQVAIEFARLWGCKEVKLIAFDACTNGNTDYAESIGYPSSKGGDPKRFIRQKDIVIRQLKKIPHEFIVLSTDQDKSAT